MNEEDENDWWYALACLVIIGCVSALTILALFEVFA